MDTRRDRGGSGLSGFPIRLFRSSDVGRRGSSRKNEVALETWRLEAGDRGSLPFEQNGPKEDIDDLRVVVRIFPL